jgi:hypothetical protein
MISNDTFYGLVFDRDRVLTLLKHCSAYELSAMLEYIIDRRFPGWNKADECFRVSRGEVVPSDILFTFFQKGKITFTDLLTAYNQVTYSSINPKYQSYYVPAGTVIEDDTPAVTDDFEDAPKEIALNNPRWEHKDTKKKENSPKTTAFDDTVVLMADVTGIPENGPVTFDVFDISGKAPVKIDTARGKNVGGVAQGVWVVTDKISKGSDAKLEFQAKVKDKTSTRCEIKCLKKELLGCITLCLKNTISDHILTDIDCILNGQGIELTGKTDSNGLVSWNDLPIGDYAISIKMGDQKIEKVVFWKNSSKKIQVIKIRQNVE